MKTFQTDKLPGRTVHTDDGDEYLWFSGTDYLGMGHDEIFRSVLNEGFDHYGLHFGSSRNNTLRLGIYEETETMLAKWIGSKSALLVSSGVWAGQCVMKFIDYVVFTSAASRSIQYHYAPKVHPALWGNERKICYDPWSHWAQAVVQEISESPKDTAHIICTDAIGSPIVEAFDFSIFSKLPSRKNIWIVVDESHTLGVYGKSANGLYRSIAALEKLNVIMVSSLNKALGVPAGVIACNSQTADMIRKSAWFSGASPSAPAYAYALKKLLEVNHYKAKSAYLASNMAYFAKCLKPSDLFQSVPGHPVFCSKGSALFETLLSNGIMASCFSYPSVDDAPVTRIAISTLHQKEDLDRLAEVCNQFIC
ncbi:aminotransferase class I/II-fold pyridoxal phosphate-dependent enzyme [Dyadobacter sp. CY107]|uniref:aminotransferase class I/II-fold pyridoxal phosphate-dependent enzyme n=1 Tax=Dyadobacter fanqingshengii TaxID=2906443 RepID=UPI001F401233|nr:aminotransferase class I/II-fold pyridoxal phosphate-dependent enzyme [Dyadobacter fanqingshengii]MCF2504093.1 aminotransferase class I/II-fold pyridoxal phosphate-dependent enzyme [Dyadobacter fanqingshengii]